MILIGIFLVSLLSFGGGGIFINLYELLYVDILKIMDEQTYYNLLAIINVFPGPTGSKLANIIYLDQNIILIIISTIVFLIPPIIFIIILFKFLKKYEKSKLFNQIIEQLKPVICASFFYISYTLVEKVFLTSGIYLMVIFMGLSFIFLNVFKKSLYFTMIILVIFNIILLLVN